MTMINLYTLKKEAREDLINEYSSWMEFDKASGSRYINLDEAQAFLDTLIDKVVEATEIAVLELSTEHDEFGEIKHSVKGAFDKFRSL